MMMTNDNKDETLIYWTVCVINIIILKVNFGLGKLALVSASWFWPRPHPRPRKFVLGLGLGDLSSASRICPHLTSLQTNGSNKQEILLIMTNLITPRALFSPTYLLNLIQLEIAPFDSPTRKPYF